MELALIFAAMYVGLLLIALAWNAIKAIKIIRTLAISFLRPQPEEELVSSPRVVITLVHGTWAGRAEWTASSSPLCSTLRKAANGPVRFERFIWTGRNSIAARRAAVDKLVSQLNAALARWPHADHFLIGHSHGGNIAFHALGDPTLGDGVLGLVCLSTPFLTVSRRDLASVGRTVFPWLPLLIFVLGVYVTVVIASSRLAGPVFDSVAVLATIVGIVLGVQLRPKRIARFSNETARALKYPNVPTSKVLVIRTFADEASTVIVATQFISWVSGMIWFAMSGLIGTINETVGMWRSRLTKRPVILTIVCLAILAVASVCENLSKTAVSPTYSAALSWVGVALVVLWLLVIGLVARGGWIMRFSGAVMLAFLATPFFLMISILGIAIGPEMLLAGFAFRVTAESTPPGGAWTVWQVPSDPLTARSDGALLMHSDTYQNEEALRIIAQWFARLNQDRS